MHVHPLRGTGRPLHLVISASVEDLVSSEQIVELAINADGISFLRSNIYETGATYLDCLKDPRPRPSRRQLSHQRPAFPALTGPRTYLVSLLHHITPSHLETVHSASPRDTFACLKALFDTQQRMKIDGLVSSVEVRLRVRRGTGMR